MNSSTLDALPSNNYLSQIVLDETRDLPLHAQLRNSLQRIILDCFEDENRSYSETQLVQHLGVSQGTVRRALADLAPQGLLEKRPARGTLVRKSAQNGLRSLAVFLPEFSSPGIARILNLLNTECLNQNIHLQPFYTHRGERLVKAYEQLKFKPREGAVVLLTNAPRATVELSHALRDKGYRCVAVDTLVSSEEQLSFVCTCNRSGIRTGMDHLRSLGHRRICLLVNEPEEVENVAERISAFEEYCAESGLDGKVCHAGAHLWENSAMVAENVMEEIWNSRTRPTAIFAISDLGAFSAVRWLQQRGVRMPREVSVLGFDGIDMGALVHPALSSVGQPFEEISKTVFEILKDPSGKPRKVFLPPDLILRESTSAPASGPRI